MTTVGEIMCNTLVSVEPTATVAEAGIGFCFAPVFHAGFRHTAGPRRELGVCGGRALRAGRAVARACSRTQTSRGRGGSGERPRRDTSHVTAFPNTRGNYVFSRPACVRRWCTTW